MYVNIFFRKNPGHIHPMVYILKTQYGIEYGSFVHPRPTKPQSERSVSSCGPAEMLVGWVYSRGCVPRTTDCSAASIQVKSIVTPDHVTSLGNDGENNAQLFFQTGQL